MRQHQKTTLMWWPWAGAIALASLLAVAMPTLDSHDNDHHHHDHHDATPTAIAMARYCQARVSPQAWAEHIGGQWLCVTQREQIPVIGTANRKPLSATKGVFYE